MKTKNSILLPLFIILAGLDGITTLAQQGVPAAGAVSMVDIDGDGQPDFTEDVVLSPLNLTDTYVFYSLSATDTSIIIENRTSLGIFGKGQTISPSATSLIGTFNIQFYLARNLPGGWQYLSNNSPNNLDSYTNIYLGARLSKEDGFHAGWVLLARPNRDITTPFSIVNYGYNPVPGEAIQAGLPPSPPRIATEMTADGLRLSWSSALINWNLQSAESLRLPVQWNNLGSGATNAIIPLEGATRYFRLIKP